MLEDPRQFIRTEKRFAVVEIKSIGNSVRLRSITGAEMLAVRQMASMKDRMAYLLERMVVDLDGNSIFTRDYVEQVLQSDAALVDELFDACQKHAFDISSVDDAKKN